MEFKNLIILFTFTILVHFVASKNSFDNFFNCFVNKTQNSNIIYTPYNPSYKNVLHSYSRNLRFNRATTPKPAIIVTLTDQTHVQATVLCAKSAGIQLRTRSGGHDYEGLSYVSNTTFVVLDMFNLREITIDSATQTVWVQAGATLGELYYKIANFSKVLGFPAGVCPTVGIGGHLSGGGYGNMLRKYGLSVDHIIDGVIVDANGRVLDRKGMGEDLFWAIRGGGGASFGVVLAYKIELVLVPPVVTVFNVPRTLEENASSIVDRWQYVASEIDDDLFLRVILRTAENGGGGTIRANFKALYLGDAQSLIQVMNKKFPELGLKKDDCKEMSWIESVLYWADLTKIDALLDRIGFAGFIKRKSDYVKTPIPKTGLELLWKKMIGLGNIGLVFNPYGGKMSEIPETSTPFPHRAGNLFKIQYQLNWTATDIGTDQSYVNKSQSLYDFLTPYVSKNPRESFLNYRDIDIGTSSFGNDSYEKGKVYGMKYFKGNFERLVKVKTIVDPENFFRDEKSIPTSKYFK